MNPNKRSSEAEGRQFLGGSLAMEQKLLSQQLELSSHSITHNGVMGDVNEQLFIDALRRYLPRRYGVEQGIVIDSKGSTSDPIDIVIYDPQYTPPLLKQMSHRYILAEAVYGVLEVKPALNRDYLIYAAKKAETVRKLERTSVPIPHAGKFHLEAKTLFPIIAGIVGIRSEWKDGLDSRHFRKTINQLLGDQTLNPRLSNGASSL